MTAESHHGRTTPTGNGTETEIDATEVVVVLGVAAVVVRLRLLMRPTVEVLLKGLEASLHHFQPVQIRFVTIVVARVALRERTRGSEGSKVSVPSVLSIHVLTSLKIARVQMMIHPMVHLSGLRSTGTPVLVWAKFWAKLRTSDGNLDVTEEGLDVTESNFLNPIV